MPIADPRNRAISETRQSNVALRFKGAMEVASDLRFRAAISEPKTPSFCGISGDLALSTRKSLAIAIVRFWWAESLVVHAELHCRGRCGFNWPVPGQLDLHGRCRCGVLLSPCFGALFIADLIVGIEE